MRLPGPLRAYRGQLDPWIWVPALVLVLFGLFTVYSATEYPDSPRAGYFLRHLLAFPPALAVFVLALVLPLRMIEDLSPILCAVSCLLLVAVLIVGVEVYGARRWLGFGSFRIQPAEIAKVATVVLLAHFLAGKRNDPSRRRALAVASAIILVPMLLVLKEPDLGTSGAFVAAGFAMLIWAGLPWLHLFLVLSPLTGLALLQFRFAWFVFLAAGLAYLWKSRVVWPVLAAFLLIQIGLAVGGPVVWDRLEPYQQARLRTFVNPEIDRAGAGYQVHQSKIAIGSGRVGFKPLEGSQKALAFLPQQHTDFIYSVIGEELGFPGSIAVILLFAILIARGYKVAMQCRGRFSGLLAVGLSTLLLYHAGVNMGMTVGLVPVTGLPLPFISYGGSFLVSTFLILGLLLNISAHRFDY